MNIFCFLHIFLSILCQLSYSNDEITKEQRLAFKNKAKEMFFHGYNNYMKHAFPADELMPLSCKGRYRNSEPSRGDIDDALGNFSLTLIDSLDTLFILNELDEFEHAVLNVLNYVSLDTDVDVSVFETNIRVLGGLLGGHVAAMSVKVTNSSRMAWYTEQLLDMSIDVANRLLPAFNTSTGLPYPRVNLHRGTGRLPRPESDTCTACAGTMILEFAVLSRLTGNPIYEQKASHAMSFLWKKRNRYSNLVGTVINIHNGEWIGRESGVGAGIDSYYEYLLKAYGQLGEPVYLHRFQTHYSAVERYLGAPGNLAFPFSFLSVYMHRPSERSKNFMDSLQAFWPGLQTISGDLNAAVALHEMLYQVHKRNRLLPEAFRPDLSIHWAHHLLRPELIESTYLLHKATNDPYYLHVGSKLLESLELHARVPCGYAALKDIRTMEHSDQMDSYVLAETFKYLYLLFSEPSDLPVNIDDYMLTTEAHLLPIGLPQIRLKSSIMNNTYHYDRDEPTELLITKYAHCKSPLAYCQSLQACDRLDDADPLITFKRIVGLLPACKAGTSGDEKVQTFNQYLEAIRAPLRSIAAMLLEGKHSQQQGQYLPASNELNGPLVQASVFQPDNITHLQMLGQMGILLSVAEDGKLQLKLDRSKAESPALAYAGMQFIDQIVQMNADKNFLEEKSPAITAHTIAILQPPYFGRLRFKAGPSRFGLFPRKTVPSATLGDELLNDAPKASDISEDEDQREEDQFSSWEPVTGPLVLAHPFDACVPVYSDGFYRSVDTLHDFGELETDGSEDSDEADIDGQRGVLSGAIAVIRRGTCAFSEKARHLKKMGAVGAIVIDSTLGTSSSKHKFFYMSNDNMDSQQQQNSSLNAGYIDLPFVFLYNEEGKAVISAMNQNWRAHQQPTYAFISKEADIPRIFSYALRVLNSTREDASNQCFIVVPTINQLNCSNCSPSSPSFRLDLLTDSSAKDVDWQFTLFPSDSSVNEALFYFNQIAQKVYSKDSFVWSNFIDQNWPTTAGEDDCKDLLLALVEAVISHTLEPLTLNYSVSPIIMSDGWRAEIESCLRPLRDSSLSSFNQEGKKTIKGQGTFATLTISFRQASQCS